MYSTSHLSLLYIDDDSNIRKNAIEYFSRRFKSVFEATNGLDGYRMYEKYKPDIIISDIKMPYMNGLELSKKIRSVDKKTPIIILSAFTDTALLLQAIEYQLVKYLIKPLNEISINEALSLACETLNHQQKNIYNFNHTTLYDSFNKTLLVNNAIVKLTHYELQLLDTLIKHSPRIVTYNEIENCIWTDEGMSIDSLRTIVRSLRKKMTVDAIENISGLGYRIVLNIS